VADLKLEDKAAWINNQQDWPDIWGAPETLFGVFRHQLVSLPAAAGRRRVRQALADDRIRSRRFRCRAMSSYNGYVATRELLRGDRASRLDQQPEGHQAARRSQDVGGRPHAALRRLHRSSQLTRCSRPSILARRNIKPRDKTDLFDIISWTKPEAAMDDAAPGKCKLKPDAEGTDLRAVVVMPGLVPGIQASAGAESAARWIRR